MKINTSLTYSLNNSDCNYLTIFRQAIAFCLVMILVMITLLIGFMQKVEANSIVKPQTYFLQTLQTNDVNISNNIPSNIPESQMVDPKAFQAGEKAVTGVSKGINSTLENVKEKLNLDEPLPESTKKFLANPLAPQDQNIPKKGVGSNV
jgi:hypothetical protein